MNFEDNVGKKVKNKETGQVTTIQSYADRPSVQLDNGIGFCVGSKVAGDWEILEEDKQLLKGIDIDGSMQTIVEGYKEKGVCYITRIKRENIEDNWNLGDKILMDYTKIKGEGPMIRTVDFRTFIQKVKEDTEKLKEQNSFSWVDEFNKILDKRAGDLK